MEILKEILGLKFVAYALYALVCFVLGGVLAWGCAQSLQALRRSLARQGKTSLSAAMGLPEVGPLSAVAGLCGVLATGLLLASAVYLVLFGVNLRTSL